MIKQCLAGTHQQVMECNSIVKLITGQSSKVLGFSSNCQRGCSLLFSSLVLLIMPGLEAPAYDVVQQHADVYHA